MEKLIEGVKDTFKLEEFLQARKLTIEATHEIAKLIRPGMQEADGHQLIDDVLKKYGCEKKWHPNKFRIGANTLKSFREASKPGIKLSENDIFFIDIGPVFNGYEGDFGKTFVIGKNPEFEAIAQNVEKIFHDVAKLELSGQALYTKAVSIANAYGYELNLKMNGHRLGDFPHAIHFKGKLQDIDIIPCNNLWVLEILIRHPKKDFGAFFEDIIRRD